MYNGRAERIKGAVFLISAFTLAGTSVIAARLLTGKLGNFTVTAVSMLIASACLAPFCARRIKIRDIGKSEWINIIVQACFGVFLFRLFLLCGIARTSTTEAGILTGATPAITTVLAVIVLKEKAGITKITGILATTAGILLVNGIIGSEIVIEHLAGNMLVICAAASESVFNISSRIYHLKTHSNKRLKSNEQAFIVAITAFILCIVPAVFENPIESLLSLSIETWLVLIWYGAFVTALAFYCWYSGIKRHSASAAAAFSGMMPLSAMIFAALILGEAAQWHQWLGGGFVITGMTLASLGKKAVLVTAKAGAASF